jgi:superfamily II DNA or RNA helicase
MATARHPKATFFVQRQLFTGLTSFAELEQKIAALPDEQSRGDAFEVFAEAYLATQRKYDATQVWPHSSVPLDILKNLGLTQQDQGVDGVLQTLLGQFNAYQVKFRTGRPTLTWRELSTFIGLADSPHIHSRVLLTNCDELPPVLNDRQGFFCIRGADLDRLEATDFRAIEAWLADAAFIAPKKSPQPHQTEALDTLLPALQTHDRVSAIMACGTGKTLVALWVAENIAQASSPGGSGGVPATRILVLLPSLALLRQTLHEWLRETHLPNLAYLCVCSDPTVKEGIDALTTQQSDLDFQVSTDAASVRSFLDAPFAGVKMIFSTYQSASVVGAAMQPGAAFDFAVFDEAHKTAGREGRNFAFALEDKNLPIRKRLFLTATPRHYSPLSKSKDGDAQLVFSMDKTETYGTQVYRLPFGEAAKRGIICRYKVIISVITSQQVTNELLSRGEVLVNGDAIRARQVANQIALKDAIEKYGVNKVFTFHSTVASAASFTNRGNEGVATHLPEFKTLHVNGAMPTARRERVMREFRECRRGIISNARCLTEGVDVPAVDMVAFLSPRRSRVDIVQATGRAMRKAGGKKLGYILVPLYVEQFTNESVEQAVLRSDFSEVWEVLQSLQEQDEILAEVIREMRMERGQTKGFDDSRFREIVPILGPSVSLEVLRQSITAACLDAIGEKWFERYGQLLEYRAQHGDCDMPARLPANQKLATWVVNQRVLQKEGKLEEEKINLLNRLGFKWSPHETTWREQYLALMDYKRRYSDCRVPQNWKDNRSLSHWIKTQRMDYRHGDISRERIALLEKIGFEWWIGLPTWDDRFAELCAYKEKFKNTLVPAKWPENPLLGRWVSSQRYKRTAGKLRREYEDKLNSIGFEWRAPTVLQSGIPLAKRIEALLAHKAEHGHLTVSQHDKKYLGLARWMMKQRGLFKNGTISEELKKQLDAIGFSWRPTALDTDKQWFEIFARYKIYAAANGVLAVRVVDDQTRRLNRWVLWQRRAKMLGKLSDKRIHALQEIGFVWQINKRKSAPEPKPARPKVNDSFRPWNEMFSELVEFFKLHGHCNVPIPWQANPELAQWVNYQRAAKRQGRLAPDQMQRMNEIGFAWTTNDGDWDAMFAKLAEHLRPAHHGKARNAAATLELKRWMLTQRQLKKRGELEPEREQKLNSIGFEWQPYSQQWQEMFDALRKFHAEHSHCRVPSKWPQNSKLASWVATQRARKAEGKLSVDRIAKLNTLGFSWRVNAGAGLPSHEAWETMFDQLKQFHAKHGHARVPQKYPDNRKLAWWVSTQRRNCRNNKLEAEQIARLDGLAFDWSPKSGGTAPDNEAWQEMLSALESFKAEHGHCRVPAGWPENPKLANWVASQRQHKRTGYLKPERVVALDRIGFDWILGRGTVQAWYETRGSTHTAAQFWEIRFQELQQYKQAHGNCLVPQSWKGNRRLADWVSEQRVANNKGLLDAERFRRLDELDFDWDPNTNHWEKYFCQLIEFKQEYGHTNVPQRSGKYRELGTWVRNQRAAKRYKRPIMAERAKRLDEIGFVWVLVEPMAWEKMFAALVEYKRVHNHCNVPQKAGEHKRLGKWVNTQRTHFYRGTIRPDRQSQLESVGFVWNLRPNVAAAR